MIHRWTLYGYGDRAMFTGIVESVGTIMEARPRAGGKRLRIRVGPRVADCAPGASVCVSGVCLTVTDVSADTLDFEVIAETIRKSTLNSKRVGDRVNLERSLRVGDRLDGHFVQGHVDGTAVIDQLLTSAREHVLGLCPEESLMPYIVPKGSVAVDGVSLTIASVGADGFSICLIPTTWKETTLSSLTAGDVVNIETDIIARTIVHRLSAISTSGGLTLESLKEAGLA